MKGITNIQRRSDDRMITAGIINTQNLLAVYSTLSTQPDISCKIHPKHDGHHRGK